MLLMVKKFFKILLVVIIMLCAWNCNSIWYGMQQGKGQLGIIYGAEPVSKFLENPKYPDSLKNKLKLISEIKAFAIDSLGINPSDNYEKLYDQKGKPVMWVVTGCDQDSLNPYFWKFPFLGKFSYKGYFDKERAVKEFNQLKEEGYDADIGVVNAWSTLGWFKDPIMSSMLDKSPGQLARVIIHELTHGTLYVKNDIQFNENLASFVGDKGAILFLESKYGKPSLELNDYLNDFEDMAKVRAHLLTATENLKAFYAEADSTKIKKEKQNVIKQQILSLDTLDLHKKKKLKNLIGGADTLNNTFFTDFLTYRKEQNSLEKQFKEEFNSDFKKYLLYLKETYPSL